MKRQGAATVLIAGAGEIGSRHLQSLAVSLYPLEIHIFDIDSTKLQTCVQRWQQVKKSISGHQIFLHTSLSEIPRYVNLAIVSCTARVRPEIIENIARISEIKYWVLEKILAQSPHGIERIKMATAGAQGCWVNYYMSSQELYQKVKSKIDSSLPLHMKIFGGDWGMVCNSLHFIHLHAWLAEASLVSLRVGHLATHWHEAKRPGNWEIYGQLTGSFENGSRIELCSEDGPVGYEMLIDSGLHQWQIFEEAGRAVRDDGMTVECEVPYQSGRRLLLDILDDAQCQLPALDQVSKTDVQFLELMIDQWRERGHPQAQSVPIT